MAIMIHLPILFEKLEKLPEKEGVKIANEALRDREKLLPIWGRIMYYSTTVENILKEHLNIKNKGAMLGRLINLFEIDCKKKRLFTKYSKLISTLKKLNKKCRVAWSHGCLTYSLKKGKLTKHLIYTEIKRNKKNIKRKIEIGNDYFDQVANKLYPEAIDELMKMVDAKDSKGKPHLNRKTSFIIPVQNNNGKFNFIFVK